MYFNTREIMPHTSINSIVVDDDVLIYLTFSEA